MSTYTPIEILGFSDKTRKALIDNGILTVEEVISRNRELIDDINKECANEVMETLSERGIYLK